MIVKERSWLAMLFSIRGSGLHRTFPRIVIILAVATAITLAAGYTRIVEHLLTPTPFTLIGVALGIFLGFRNNAAYDRYWEGRKLWGSLVNTTRTFARQCLTIIKAPSDSPPELLKLQRELVQGTIGFAHSVRHLLRESSPNEDLKPFLTSADWERVSLARHAPLAILKRLAERLAEAARHGWIADVHLPALDSSLTELTNILGACERIKNTPFPYAYSALLHQCVAFYCVCLPFGIVREAGALTPFVVMLISHAFLGLDEIGDEIEEPFGEEPHHLPLTALCRTIEINLLELLGEKNLPPPLAPVDHVLS